MAPSGTPRRLRIHLCQGTRIVDVRDDDNVVIAGFFAAYKGGNTAVEAIVKAFWELAAGY